MSAEEGQLVNLKIRDLDEDIGERRRVRAALNGRSMEEEARAILNETLVSVSATDLWLRSRALFAGSNGVDLEIPSRAADRPPLAEISDDAVPFGDWLVAVSRSGADLEVTHDVFRSALARSAPLE